MRDGTILPLFLGGRAKSEVKFRQLRPGFILYMLILRPVHPRM